MRPARISFYGNFGAGNLGNECTLQTVIEHTRRRLPDARLLCWCTDPDDVRRRHGIAAFCSEALGPRSATAGLAGAQLPGTPSEHGRRGMLGQLQRLLRIAFYRLPIELAHSIRCLKAIRREDLLIVAGTGIVADYMCGPFGWPYDMFKLSLLGALCRVKVIFLSVGAGPITHPFSRWFIKRSLGLASYRSYRDEASRQYLQGIGFDAARDPVYPDVVFGLTPEPGSDERTERRRVIGLGLKDYGSTDSIEAGEFREYLNTMAALVGWLQGRGYAVRLLIGDIQYDTRVREEFVTMLKSRNLAAEEPLLIAEPALTVEELLRQLAQTDAVLSPRYHNLVLALILNKPVLALSDHAKLDSLLGELGLTRYRVPLKNLTAGSLIERFQQLEADSSQLRPYIGDQVDKLRAAVNAQYECVLALADAT